MRNARILLVILLVAGLAGLGTGLLADAEAPAACATTVGKDSTNG